ncbi:HNH endonuclease [Dyadobacter chenhuakuii]|uniref:HNH endonuclease n=1 Tax=Dyadobacter chenhuakuii TaxID=2909339 RepID=A0ABY4XGU4_9BACT|nr:HNH endonuclease [Dyadobacter chenhuakuii]MCF2495613.1 HNH endonuclease [Dyadobacter chenhuakuii]USJ29647.1 HNH endonuclease [Dyadobacter chenhuakuii]
MALVFEQVDLDNIVAARAAGNNIWDNPILSNVKIKIKDHFLAAPFPKCCYCSRSAIGEFRMVIDIEHVLPKSRYDSLMFDVQNLNISCKRCNMEIKRSKIDFVVDVNAMKNDYFNSVHYKFVHPNLDKYTEHIRVASFRIGDSILNKYLVRTESKGRYTYNYFSLNELEIDNLNQAQGLEASASLTSRISTSIRIKIAQLLLKL